MIKKLFFLSVLLTSGLNNVYATNVTIISDEEIQNSRILENEARQYKK